MFKPLHSSMSWVWTETTVHCHSSADKKQLPKALPDHLKSFPHSLVSLHFHSTPRAEIVGLIYLIMCIWGWGFFREMSRITIPVVLISARQQILVGSSPMTENSSFQNWVCEYKQTFSIIQKEWKSYYFSSKWSIIDLKINMKLNFH